MKYGFPYKGSKNKLAERIVELFPKADNFYDLFCGGGERGIIYIRNYLDN